MKRRNFSYNVEIMFFCFILLLMIYGTFLLIQMVIPHIKGNFTASILILLAEIVLCVVGYFVFKKNLNFIKGDDGELDVRNVLEKLPDGYYHLPDLMFPDSKNNIDFAVFGASGVWAIEVKNYRSKEILLNDFLRKNIWQVKKEAEALQNVINLPVTPLLVFTNKKTKIHFGMSPVEGVYVIGIKWLEELITKHSSGYLTPAKAFELKESLKNFTSRI